MLDPKPDVFFSTLHGRFGEHSYIQGLLKFLNIPYTHSGVLASAFAMDKPTAKTLLVAHGIPVSNHQLIKRADLKALSAAGKILPPPFAI